MKNRYARLSVVLMFVVCLLSFSCKISLDSENNDNNSVDSNTGIIIGKVKFSNGAADANKGIVVTLDKTDGLMASEVSGSVSDGTNNRSVVSTITTSDDGSYTFENLEEGTYTIYASCTYSSERAVYTNVVVHAGETTMAEALQLTATGIITGTITLDNKSSGNTGFLVFVAGTSFMAMTDDSGNYTISGVPAGNGYQLVATKGNVIHSISSDVSVPANDTVKIQNNNFTTTEIEAAVKGEKGDQGDPGNDGSNGTDGTNGTNGNDGVSIIWLGTFASENEITNPKYLNAYFNTTNGCSYIFDGTKWQLLARSGMNGNKDNSFAIATVVSNQELTNEDVTITINISENELFKVGYVYSTARTFWINAKEVLYNSEFVPISVNTDGQYTVTAACNGYYTFAAMNSDGYYAMSEEYIMNIDKTPPGSISSLYAIYNFNNHSITVNWTNPDDSDLDYVGLSYTKDGITIVSEERITDSSYIINDVNPDESEYVFTLHTVDKFGNTSNIETENVIPTENFSIKELVLSKYHIENNASNSITVIAKLNSIIQDDDVIDIIIQITNKYGNVTNISAILDRTTWTATATISRWSGFDFDGNYTVACKINDYVDTMHTARFNVSDPASITNLLQSTDGVNFSSGLMQMAASSVTDTSTEVIRIIGSNLDLTVPSIQLFNSDGVAYFDEPVVVDTSSFVWTASEGSSDEQIIDTIISIPKIDDIYPIQILFDYKVTSRTLKLQIYDVPKFNNFKIPQVSVTKAGNTVTAKIKGKNFSTPDVNLTDFYAVCSEKPEIVQDSVFSCSDDSTLTTTFTVPDVLGEYDITVGYGSESITESFKVLDFTNYQVGDVLLKDGTIIPYDENNLTFTEEQKSKAVGVMYGFNEYDAPAGWLYFNNGLVRGAHDRLRWNSEGSERRYPEIECTINEGMSWDVEKNAETAIITGDLDGSDNLDYVCSVDYTRCYSDDSIKDYYEAFWWAKNIVPTNFGKYSKGWYLPSIAELCYIYRNKEILNSVISALDGCPMFVENGFYYWSASTEDYYGRTFGVNFTTGEIRSLYRDNSYNYNDISILSIHLFDNW